MATHIGILPLGKNYIQLSNPASLKSIRRVGHINFAARREN